MEAEPNHEEAPSRFVVGIDLGTTNSAVTYVDTKTSAGEVQVFPIPQLVAPGEVEQRETLPSFYYQAASGEMGGGALNLPWDRSKPSGAVGTLARDHGRFVPSRQIASAKSWLCHSGVDRSAELLPWHAAADVDRLSPVAASALFLEHIRKGWDQRYPEEPLASQDIVLTLPASFDEVARELTVQAAAEAGLSRVVLIEEPQAAFYAWLYLHRDDWQQNVSANETILVCDVGGGTTDFTLIRVRVADSSESAGTQETLLQFHRVAVGDHLILGGDNLDLALARHVEASFLGEDRLEARQWDVLIGVCRDVKETLLGEDAPLRMTVHVPGSGARLVGGGLQAEVGREAIRELLVDGFFPRVALTDQPTRHQSGFQEFGLPYASDPAITRHLAAFLMTHREQVRRTAGEDSRNDPIRPDVVLFNGGVFAATTLRDRLVEVLTAWFVGDDDPQWKPRVLENDRLDLAVARGAAYFGMVRRGQGVRIEATLARSYYIGVDSNQADNQSPNAICLVPGNARPGDHIDLAARQFRLLISQPAEFPLFVSSVRLADQPGDMIPIDRELLTPLPPIRTVLRVERRKRAESIEVRLHAKLSEIGTLELWCTEVDGERSWRLQFDVRTATQTDAEVQQSVGESAGLLDETSWSRCRGVLEQTFGELAQDKPEELVKQLAKALEIDRGQWPPSLLRRIWETLLELESGRQLGPVHEARWLNLLGYALRPGYGCAVDDWRVSETWRTVRGKLIHSAPACRNESLILWRRIAGGLTSGQQRALAEPLLALVRAMYQRSLTGQGGRGEATLSVQDSIEVFRLLGSLELLPGLQKVKLGDMLQGLIPKRKLESARPAMIWALGRLGGRIPLYGPINTVVASTKAQEWLQNLLDWDFGEPPDQLAVMQLVRCTNDRHRDLPERQRAHAADWLRRHQAPENYIELVERAGQLDAESQNRIFGEALPKGLRIVV